MNKTHQKRFYPITYILICINLTLFALEIKLGGSENLNTLDYLGALIPEKAIAGEWWRLLSANFLHFGWLHLITNMAALYFLGRLVEASFGLIRYLIVYFFSGIGAMFLFTLFTLKTGEENVVLVGASAAIMGLIGSILAIFLQIWFKKRTKVNARRLRLIIVVIIIQFLFDNLVPEVSFSSHLFGLIIGFVISSFLLLLQIRNKELSS
ncbi:Rhomboid family protein [Stanieria cyanosphaera PCC 7437]|uniref:Rhomboid family protein n=1 Tax=Stanieria cyanosphaera (strain ATCC 29371 / PCC 7437) TaxID=111780 RepID=K9XVM1_STAC7|nr:rhomboid family intramembrane serine protease [Stanieria cyanosphaera]AFZ36119.1 Rhomboid family protein [Stanieria cyanosphaera PCC 7437]